jgi:hypothetical protein
MKLLCILTLTACAALAAEKKVKLEDLPAAVQAAVKEQKTAIIYLTHTTTPV